MTKKILTIVSILLVALCVCSCASGKDTSVVLRTKEVQFMSETGSLQVTNETGYDLILFAGAVERDTVIGGVYRNSTRNLDLAKISGIPKSGSFILRCATYETYSSKLRVTENDVIFSALVVFDLTDPGDRISVLIHKEVDVMQNSSIYICNESENFVLELREGNPSQGRVLATLAPLQNYKRIYLAARDDGIAYDLYANWIYINPDSGEKTVMTSTKNERRRAYPESISGDITPLRFQGPSKSSVAYNIAFVNVQNNTKSGIELRNAETLLKNQKGIRFTPSGRHDVYELSSMNGASGQKYTSLKIVFDNFAEMNIASYSFRPGVKYDLIITDINGTYQYDIREVGEKSLVEDSKIRLFNEF